VVVKKLDTVGLDFIKKYEGLRLESYLCPAKIWTVGYGQTFYPGGKRVQQGDIITIEEANTMFVSVLKSFEQAVYNTTRDDITQNQFNAITSFAYNVGVQALRSSTLLKKINKNPNDPLIKDEFMKWVNGGGKILNGLVRRRKEEAELYFS
jgi:lysozyme